MLKEDVDWNLEQAGQHAPLVRIDPGAARALVAGAIRFARQNGFRLPPRYERWVNLLGDVPDPATADLRPFGRDGKLLWVGTREDLRNRLINGSVEQFLGRADADFVTPAEMEDDLEEFEDDEQDFDDEDFDEDEFGEMLDDLDERFDEIVENIHKETLENCARRGERPLPESLEAAKSLVIALLLLACQGETNIEPEEVARLATKAAEHIGGSQKGIAMRNAIEQLFRVAREDSAAMIDHLSSKIRDDSGGSPPSVAGIGRAPQIP